MSDRIDFIPRDGQSRQDRYSKALDPGFAKIDERTRKDLLSFAQEYAKKLVYFDATNSPAGDWSPFFETEQVKAQLNTFRATGELDPHAALFAVFLLLFRHAQKRLNRFTGKHLDFQYRTVLGLSERGPAPDKVHVVFSLQKNTRPCLLPAGTRLKAGKDASGRELFYALTNEIVVNRARIASLRTVHVDPGTGTVTAAPSANSADGLGAPLEPENLKWPAFGKADHPEARIGFAAGSPLLNLAEGKRTVILQLTWDDGPQYEQIPDTALQALFTGEKGWIAAASCSLKKTEKGAELVAEIGAKDGRVVPYLQKVHGGAYESAWPIMQVLINTGQPGTAWLRQARLRSLTLSVSVEGLKGLTLESDRGRIDPSKPFQPFGPDPDPGSYLVIRHPEFMSRDLSSFKIHIDWHKVPNADLAAYYRGYRDQNVKSVHSNLYFTAAIRLPDGTEGEIFLFNIKDANIVDITDADVQKKAESKKEGVFKTVKKESAFVRYRFLKNPWTKKYVAEARLTDKGRESAAHRPLPKDEDAFVIQLSRGFLQREYRTLFAAAIALNAAGTPADIPKEPYIPAIRSLTIDYTSSPAFVDLADTSENAFVQNSVEFFHVAAFGMARRHAFLTSKIPFTSADETRTILPPYYRQSELYVGIAEAEPHENITMLLNAVEGSADPLKDKASVVWSVLSDNHWQELGSARLLSDTTNSMLRSGIVTVALPAESTKDNTLLPEGMIWLRAAVACENTDAVVKLSSIRANAATAQFVDRGNDPGHLRSPLPAGRIAKLAEAAAAIKTVEQPAASFDGAMAEDRESFRSRVSERLRHKGRAVTLWDCERLVLERFVSLYRVKCINHASRDSYAAAGNVTLVVIPRMDNKNAVNRLMPCADKNLLQEIKTFLSSRAVSFIRFNVENPRYEAVRVRCRVMFLRDLDFGFYREKLQDDLKRFFSPWVYGDQADIRFGQIVHRSAVVRFIEELPYVDYVEDVKLAGAAGADLIEVAPTLPKAVITSSEEHEIEEVQR